MQGQETKKGLEVEGEEMKQKQWVKGTSIADRTEQVERRGGRERGI